MKMEDKVKDFLIKGFQPREDLEFGEEEPEPPTELPEEPSEVQDLSGIESELIRIRYMLEDLASRPSPDFSPYLTTRENQRAITSIVAGIEQSISDKQLVRAMEQLSVMREDFFKLCKGMRENIETLDADKILSSFEAYEVDMENILTDGGVFIGHFPYEKLNTVHQRIVGVVPTDDPEKDGTVAERLSDGYKLGTKVLLKERVTVFKRTEPKPVEEKPLEQKPIEPKPLENQSEET